MEIHYLKITSSIYVFNFLQSKMTLKVIPIYKVLDLFIYNLQSWKILQSTFRPFPLKKNKMSSNSMVITIYFSI